MKPSFTTFDEACRSILAAASFRWSSKGQDAPRIFLGKEVVGIIPGGAPGTAFRSMSGRVVHGEDGVFESTVSSCRRLSASWLRTFKNPI